jgi:hypothetical protein
MVLHPPVELARIFGKFPCRTVGGQFTGNPVQGKFGVEYGSALPRIKDNKTIGVTDEDAPEEYCGQQSIFPGG